MRIASLALTRICTPIDTHVTLEVRIFRLYSNALGMLDSVIIKVDTVVTRFIAHYYSFRPNPSREKYLKTTIPQQAEAQDLLAPQDIDWMFFMIIKNPFHKTCHFSFIPQKVLRNICQVIVCHVTPSFST